MIKNLLLKQLVNISLIFSLLITGAAVWISYNVFKHSRGFYGSDLEWKYFASLGGFSIFFAMFLVAITVFLFRNTLLRNRVKRKSI